MLIKVATSCSLISFLLDQRMASSTWQKHCHPKGVGRGVGQVEKTCWKSEGKLSRALARTTLLAISRLIPGNPHSQAVSLVQVQRAAAGALRTLAFKNEDNKNQIVECGALPTLIHMLRAEDTGIHYEAVGVIGNLVHSSQVLIPKD